MRGRPVAAAARMSGRSTSSNDAIFRRGDVEVVEVGHRRGVERRREPREAAVDRGGHEGLGPLPRHLRLVVEVDELTAVPEGSALHRELGQVGAHGECLGPVVLELHGVGAGVGGCGHDVESGLEAAPVVGRHLGDHDRRSIGAGLPVTEDERRGSRGALPVRHLPHDGGPPPVPVGSGHGQSDDLVGDAGLLYEPGIGVVPAEPGALVQRDGPTVVGEGLDVHLEQLELVERELQRQSEGRGAVALPGPAGDT